MRWDKKEEVPLMLFILVLFQGAPCYLGELPWLLLCNLRPGWELKLPLSLGGPARLHSPKHTPRSAEENERIKEGESKGHDHSDTNWNSLRTFLALNLYPTGRLSVKVSTTFYWQQNFIAANFNKPSVCTVAQYIWSRCWHSKRNDFSSTSVNR